ncbi:MAG: cupin domain-containing protein [Pseudomonadota bacterium]|nr:cupin [Rhodospirillaceae bacterium]MEE2721411.1 cupin domain-containing protein [Pseudomonadota bacterium]
MADVVVSMDEMKKRYAKFSDLNPSKQAFVDTRLPEHERDIFNVIGEGVTEDPELKPAISAVEGFNVTYVGADPGKGAALHAHTTVEVFYAMSGRWAVFWGDEGENEIELDTFDMVSVPVGVLRGFRNISNEHAHLMAILGGQDAGKVSWAPAVLEKAEGTGLSLDSAGNIIQAAE